MSHSSSKSILKIKIIFTVGIKNIIGFTFISKIVERERAN